MFIWLSVIVTVTGGLYLVLTNEHCMNEQEHPGPSELSTSSAGGGPAPTRDNTLNSRWSAGEPAPVNRDYHVPVDYDLSELREKGALPKLPREFVERFPCLSFRSEYELCIGERGAVDSVEPVISAPGADKEYIRTLMTWKFPPGTPKGCKRIGFSLSAAQDGPNCNKARTDTSYEVPLAWLAENTRGSIYPRPAWPRETPLKPCDVRTFSYRLWIDRTGHVENIAPVEGLGADDFRILKTLMKWRYRQLAFPVSVIEPIRFEGPKDPSCSPTGQQNP